MPDAGDQAPLPATERPIDLKRRRRKPRRLLRNLNLFGLVAVIASSAALLLLPGNDDGLLGLPDLAVGQETPRTIKSPRAFNIADIETTERLRQESGLRVKPTYDLSSGLGLQAKERIEAAFAARGKFEHERDPKHVDASQKERDRVRAAEFMRALQVTIPDDALLTFVRAAYADELRDAAIMVVRRLYEHPIIQDKELLNLEASLGLVMRNVNRDGTSDVEDLVADYSKILSVDQARVRVDEVVAHDLARLPVEQRRAVAVLVKRLLQPNLEANRAETVRRVEAARDAVTTVVIPIKLGETVLRAGDRVTERHLFLLRGMERELRSQSRVQASLGSAILIVLLVVLLYRFNVSSYRGFFPSHRDLAFLASAYLALLLLMWTGYKGALWLGEVFPLASLSAYRFALPVASGALLVRFVLGAGAASAFTPIAAVTAGWMMDADLGFAAYTLAGCLAATSLPDTERPRTALASAAFRACVAQPLIVFSLSLLESRLVLEETAPELLLAVLSGVLSASLVALAVPAVEVLFGYTTSIRLNDVADLNHPLLRDLLVEAPGTYHHSILVGTLAEAAARSIGADALLARAGAYYHDVGKIRNPRVFEENGGAVVAASSPAEQASELRSHVANGLDLAAKHRLGQPILEIIAQHHGAGKVRAAYRRALDLGSSGQSPPDPTLYSYSGPKPLGREAALVLLADFVEVATRELALESTLEPSELEASVRRVVNEVLADGQLESSELTIADLETSIRAFLRVLEERLIRRGRPTLSSLPTIATRATAVRPPLGGGLN